MPSDPRAPRFPSYCCKCSPTTVLNPAWMQDGGATFVGETKYNGQLVRLVVECRAVYAMVTVCDMVYACTGVHLVQGRFAAQLLRRRCRR